jgi:thiol-disulfide isomerase/thioredoxin
MPRSPRLTSLSLGLIGLTSFAGLAHAQVAPAAQALPALVALDDAPGSGLKLNVGNKAPGLFIEKWVKGAPVNSFESGKIYVVEFWATWCGPCRVSIPHLTELQTKLKDKGVTIIGISSNEANGLSDVEPFVQKQGDKMAYTVAWDDNTKTGKAWMEAAGQNGIPTAFIVNQDGNVAWIGHPMDNMDGVLDQVIAKTWDTNAYAAKLKKQNDERALASEYRGKLKKLMNAQKFDDALVVVEEFVEKAPGMAGSSALAMFEYQLTQAKNNAKAYALANRLLATYNDDAAWTIADNTSLEGRDLDLALKAATRAHEVTEGKEAAVTDTLARVYWEKGDKAKAIEFQQEAVRAASDEGMKADLEATLEKYKSQK